MSTVALDNCENSVTKNTFITHIRQLDLVDGDIPNAEVL